MDFKAYVEAIDEYGIKSIEYIKKPTKVTTYVGGRRVR